ncbi:PREDICTED: coiled-coil domain-containing protein 126 isoform X1 [Rhinopithecus bieti]|uniref:coiled-coil domain-containing protein 126 isoform X1 n=1 Tax=Rhinopithecus bieti TaxID=61621 RepID=UPI00083C3B00|nr:PREDICTED: coiled-coil domain-containing protein 126 isoform X1 [Rhinopithecus bieti]
MGRLVSHWRVGNKMPEPFFQRLQRVKAEGMPLAGSSSNTQEPAASLWLPRNGVVLIQGRCRAAGSTCRRFLILRLHLPQCWAPWAASPRVREGPAGRRSGSRVRGTSGVKSPQAGNKPRPDSHPPAFLQPDLEAASPVRDAADARLSALAASPRLRSSVTAATVTGSPRQADLKRTIAVLLDDILQRLVKLENKVDYIVVNGSATNTTNGTSGNLVPVTTNKRTNVSGSIR